MKLNENEMERFKQYLEECEASRATVSKYMHDIRVLAFFCEGELREKAQLVAFKQELQRRGYAPTSINSMLAAVNRFLRFAGKASWMLRYLKVQRQIFASKERTLSQSEYERMILKAKESGKERLAMLMQTICATGIRVSETRAITVECLKEGKAEIRLKGKIRLILLPKQLCRLLMDYCGRRKIVSGPVFVTRGGRPVDRSNIWKMMKWLAQAAHVMQAKAYPHNLRRLFARTYYKKHKDIVCLADILGHSSVETTRIYTTRDPSEQRNQMEGLCLLI